LHHAYLFTGTRGVGKTTVARLLAKCLNCETGVTAKPCGQCTTCREIAEGRFVDLIEVDAASRTKVDDTRDLLENVQYLPTRGRFKVYLIDEVHMLSAASFNALLKTLEEPPEHVKFLLATTDPKKVPVTVLSRCLQFQLKNLLPERIAAYLDDVLVAEDIEHDTESLDLIARAARGSMRDALSILDQSIAFGGGKLTAHDVGELLGTIERRELEDILEALAANDGPGLLGAAEHFAERSADFREVLSTLLGTLHELAVLQLVPDNAPGTDPAVAQFADRFDAETLQLLYQIVLIGLRDLALAPDPRTGFEMTLLRALAFQPDAGSGNRAGEDGQPVEKRAASKQHRPAGKRTVGAPRAAARIGAGEQDDEWYALTGQLDVGGVARMIVEHSLLESCADDHWHLTLDSAHDTLLNERQRAVVERAIAKQLGKPLRLTIRVDAVTRETPAARSARERKERHARAVAALEADATVQSLLGDFDAQLNVESVRPLGS